MIPGVKGPVLRFGTWSGVFVPSLLTILGVIMYLRLGRVVGEAGMLGAIAIIMLAHAVSVPTSLSIASLASNRPVMGGGVYYIISRSLGLPVGGAIGLALFLATALGTSLYIIGFAQTVNTLIGLDGGVGDIRITGTIACMALTGLTVYSANLAIKVQYFIMAAIALSIGSLLLGASPAAPSQVALGPATDSVHMELIFAIFFPAVTGFTAGVAMSGDLKNPRRNIPVGTLAAVGVGLLIYVGLAVFLGLNVDRAVLRADDDIWSHMALVPQLVLAGVWGATLSSAIGSLLGAPRILQALALDGIGPAFLARGSGVSNEPRVATAATFLIAEVGILIGDLDIVARVLTMFFLTTYGMLNLACGLERWANPDFRPQLRIPALVSFGGAAVCFGTMFKVDATAMVACVVALSLFYLLVKQRHMELAGGNIWGGIWQSLVRSGLYRLRAASGRVTTWRPNVMLFGGHPEQRPLLLKMAQWIVGEHGLLTNFTLLPTKRRDSGAYPTEDGEQEPDDATDPAMNLAPADEFSEFDLHSVFHTRRSCHTVPEGVRLAADWFGLVGMEPNAVMLGWPRREHKHAEYGALVRDLILRDLNLLLLEYDPQLGFGRRRRVDVWWGRHQINGGLMLMLAHFIQGNAAWRRARLRVVTLVDGAEQVEPTRRALARLLNAGRVRGEIVVMDGALESDSPLDVLRRRSKRADLVILGVAPPDRDDPAAWVAAQMAKTSGLHTVLRVSASSQSQGGQPLGLEDDLHEQVDSSIRQLPAP